jgi:hypothetical protein
MTLRETVLAENFGAKTNGVSHPATLADLEQLDREVGVPEAPPDLPADGAPIVLASVALTGADLAKPLPPLDYIVPSLAMPSGAGAPHMFGGFGFSGKTIAAQALALSLAGNRAVWHAYTGPGRPLRFTHVDNEQGRALTTRRYQRSANAIGISLEQLLEQLRVHVFPKLSNGSPIRLIPEHRNAWAELMHDCDSMLVDSLATSRDGVISENASEVRRALDMLGDISEETKCRPLVIHHANKPGDERPGVERDARFVLRGSGAIYDACDSIYVLSSAKGEAIKCSQIKARSHGESIDDFALVVADIARNDDPRWGLSVAVHGVELIEEQREKKANEQQAAQLARDVARIRKALGHGKRLARSDLQAACRVSGAHFTRAWTSIAEAGEGAIDKVKEGRAWSHMHYLKGGAR